MNVTSHTLDSVTNIIATIAGRNAENVRPADRLVEDLDLDSLQITELAQKMQNAVGRLVDEDLLMAEGMTVARCAEIAQDG